MKLFEVTIDYIHRRETVLVTAKNKEEAIKKGYVVVGASYVYDTQANKVDEIDGYKVVLVKQEKEVQK